MKCGKCKIVCPPCKTNDNSNLNYYDIELDNPNNDVNDNLYNSIKQRDANVLYNPFFEPVRRTDINNYSRLKTKYTRGPPGEFQHMGNLIRSSDNKYCKLFGRPTYPGSNNYDYYVLHTLDNGAEYKFNLDGNKELFDNDEIKIKELNTNNTGNFTVNLLKMESIRYNPWIY